MLEALWESGVVLQEFNGSKAQRQGVSLSYQQKRRKETEMAKTECNHCRYHCMAVKYQALGASESNRNSRKL